MYVYRVVIRPSPTVTLGMTINLPAGNFRYQYGTGAVDTSRFSSYRIKIAPDYGLCSNAIGTNAIVGESGGTFGSGAAQNRGTSTFVPAPYTYVPFSTSGPNDNFYGVANRTSADGSTNNSVNYFGTGSAPRVFTVWEIIGDHTGAVSPTLGNPPTSTGYALIINASYQINRAFTQNISGLCENTYYEFSAWFRNICKYCSTDSSGKGARTLNFVPGPGSDSAGVRPNLSFQIDGDEYYTSGNIAYTGTWVKKGFVFKTAIGQTNMTLTIRNNAPGGGGNDWAIDDIALATCLPNMTYTPTITPTVCTGNALVINNTVRSYFDNYTYYQWQRSTDGGTVWTNIGGPVNVPPGASPNLHYNGSNWEYTASYTVPPSQTTLANSGDKYRLIVATSGTNLTNSACRSTDATNTVTMTVLDCGPVLSVNFLSFKGAIENNKATLKWSTAGEYEKTYFDVERSFNGNEYEKISTLENDLTNELEVNSYTFTDPDIISGKVYYRIRMRTVDNRTSFSRVLQLSYRTEGFNFGSVVNPFGNTLYFDISSYKAGTIKAELVNQFGTPVKRKTVEIQDGTSQLTFDNTGSLPTGLYILKVEFEGKTIYSKVVKRGF